MKMKIELESQEEREVFERMPQHPSRKQLMAEVAVLTELVRVLSDRVAELEKTEPVAWNLKDVTDAYKLGAKSQQGTWVGLTDEDRAEILNRKWWDFEDEFDVDGFLRLAEAKLKEKNT